MEISNQEHDPFTVAGGQQGVSIACLIAALVDAKRHWERAVQECAWIEVLVGEQFGVG